MKCLSGSRRPRRKPYTRTSTMCSTLVFHHSIRDDQRSNTFQYPVRDPSTNAPGELQHARGHRWVRNATHVDMFRLQSVACDVKTLQWSCSVYMAQEVTLRNRHSYCTDTIVCVRSAECGVRKSPQNVLVPIKCSEAACSCLRFPPACSAPPNNDHSILVTCLHHTLLIMRVSIVCPFPSL